MSSKGYHHTAEAKARIAAAKVGMTHTPEAKLAIGAASRTQVRLGRGHPSTFNRGLTSTERRGLIKTRVMVAYSGTFPPACKCGFDDLRALVIDHINGDGWKDRAVHKRVGYRMYRWLLVNKFPPGYQVLCYNCNAIKAVEMGETGVHGHDTEPKINEPAGTPAGV